MLGFSFGEPWSLLLIMLVVPLWLLWRFETRRRAAADRDYGGAAELRLGTGTGRRRLGSWLLWAGVVLIVVALVASPSATAVGKAEANETANREDLTSGCGGYPWSQLTPQ